MQEQYEAPPPAALVAYTDGSNVAPLRVAAGVPLRVAWAFVVMHGEQVLHQEAGELDSRDLLLLSMNNVAGELAAVLRAVAWAKANGTPVVICTDFKNGRDWALGTIRCRHHHVKRYAGWMRANAEHVAGWCWVRGHKGVPGNELAHRLAYGVINPNGTRKWKKEASK